MARRRPRYTAEFKAEAVRLARVSTDTVPKIARDIGVSTWTLRHWLKAAGPTGAPPLTADEWSELKQLRREVRQLREERDILKKATAFFARHGE